MSRIPPIGERGGGGSGSWAQGDSKAARPYCFLPTPFQFTDPPSPNSPALVSPFHLYSLRMDFFGDARVCIVPAVVTVETMLVSPTSQGVFDALFAADVVARDELRCLAAYGVPDQYRPTIWKVGAPPYLGCVC